MRGWALVVSLSAGCGFSVPDGAGNGASDAPGEGIPADAPRFHPACATDPAYAQMPGSAHRYRKVDATNYDGGIDRCTSDGAHLAVIDSAEENAFVKAMAGEDVWIGLDDLTTEGTFKWVTGTTSPFRAFASNEPNDNGTEDCTYAKPDGKWNDTKCGEVRPAICECDSEYQPPPTPACRNMLAQGTDLDGRTYFVRTAAKNFADAEADCVSIGAHLAVVSDEDERSSVDGRFIGDSWIGYSDTVVEGTFVWVNGAPSGYTNWGAFEPNGGATEGCVVMNIFWYDVACSQTKQYACECDPAPP
jgi:hypothetical protein